MNRKTILMVASTFGILGVILGAMGAHALEGTLSADQLDSYKTAVRYQMWHALAMLFLFGAAEHLKLARITAVLWTFGVLFFSGSIYLLSMRDAWGIDFSWLGPVTPIGGLLMIIGWILLLISAFRLK
jgi:uncharacterized membrane protein YgdD (TMEM256/DUF423 family)